MHIGLHVKYPLFLSDFNENSVFSIDLRKITKYKFFIKIRKLGAKLFHEDVLTSGQTYGETDVTRETVAFRNFASAPKRQVTYVSELHGQNHLLG